MKFLKVLKTIGIVLGIALAAIAVFVLFMDLCNLGILPEGCKAVSDWIVNFIGGAVVWVKDIMIPWITNTVSGVITWIVNAFNAAILWIVNAFHVVINFFVRVWQAVSGFFVNLFSRS